MPKAAKMDLIVQKCVELGVSEIIPTITDRVDVKLKGEFKDFELKRIDDNHCNPKKIWQEMGEPKVLKDNEIIDIINVSKLKNENINVHYNNIYYYK